MEDTIFGFVLFIFVYGFLVWITDGGNLSTSATVSPAQPQELDRKNEKDSNSLQVSKSVADKPIEQQLEDVLWDDSDEDGDNLANAPKKIPEVSMEKSAATATTEMVTEVAIAEEEIEKLTYRKARKVAKKLGIKQKVNGHDARKDWLVAQIKMKVKSEPQLVRQACDEVLKAA